MVLFRLAGFASLRVYLKKVKLYVSLFTISMVALNTTIIMIIIMVINLTTRTGNVNSKI